MAVGIVHFDAGGFHRAHQAMYVDALLEKGLASRWGICGVGVLAAPSTCIISLTITEAEGYLLFANCCASTWIPRRSRCPGWVCDTIARLCCGASDRIRKRLLPVDPRPGAPIRLSAPSGVNRATYTDQLADELAPLARTERDNPTSVIETLRYSAISSTRSGSPKTMWRR